MADPTAIRNAATVILLRDRATRPSILMGQRGAKAAFMPNKFVFPGGAVDASDTGLPFANPLDPICKDRLTQDHVEGVPDVAPDTLAAAAIRELFEETGQALAQPGAWPSPPEPWQAFAQHGQPNAAPLRFVFRALTPPGRPRRFDARFFLVDASALTSDPDDFSAASDELAHLQWVPLDEARGFDMPFITEVVLAEVQASLDIDGPPASVPFFRNDDEASLFLRIHGRAQTCD